MDALVSHPVRRITDFFGRTWFLVVMLAFLMFWYVYNLIALAPFDPPPFDYLQGFLGGVMALIDVMILVSSQITQRIAEKQTAYVITMLENSLVTMEAVREMGDRESERDARLLQIIKEGHARGVVMERLLRECLERGES